jgi:outer membrane lipoprotein-sorting protein
MNAAMLVLLLAPAVTNGVEALSGEEILDRVDQNYKAVNRRTLSSMTIHGRRGSRTVRSRSWVEGTERAFTEYLDPPREKGTKMLKLEDELWTWSPSTDRIIRIAGHMLRQSVMGSDLSYEDFMEDPVLNNLYDAEVTGGEEINARACYVLALEAKVEEIAYDSRKLWVDKERFLPMREERYAKSGKLLKLVEINEVMQQGDRWYPRRVTFKDTLKRGDGTVMRIESIEFDVEIPEYLFSKASLKR